MLPVETLAGRLRFLQEDQFTWFVHGLQDSWITLTQVKEIKYHYLFEQRKCLDLSKAQVSIKIS